MRLFVFSVLPSTLTKWHSIIQDLKPFCEEFFVLLFRTIHHTFTAGWRPESNRASFLMMLPTPGMMAWSRRTSQSILLLWLLTASSEREELKFREHISRLSIAFTLCSQSSVSLQAHARQGQLVHSWDNTFPNSFSHVSSVSLFVMGWNSKGEISDSRNVCLATERYTRISQSMNRPNVKPQRLSFSCDNNHHFRTEPNVGHSRWMRLIHPPKVNFYHLNLSNWCLCPRYLASTALSKKHTTSLVRCISSTGMESVLSFLSAGFMRIDPFIPKWNLTTRRKWRRKKIKSTCLNIHAHNNNTRDGNRDM